MERTRTETIRTKMGMKGDVSQETEEEQFIWHWHAMRTEGCRITRQVAEWDPQGKESHFRPESTWMDGIRKSTHRRNFEDEDYFNRKLWKK
jgi:hypothetical protein